VDETWVTAALDASDLIDGIDEIIKSLNVRDKDMYLKSYASLMEIYKNTKREDNPVLVRYRLK
jgi:hypothetical protein